MKTSLIAVVIVILIAVVAYQGYQINQLKNTKLVVNEPEVIINIQKQEPKSESKTEQNLSSLEETIKQDFKKLFGDIFGNKQVQDELKKGVEEFKSGLNDPIGQIQKDLSTLSKNNSFFNDILKEFDLKSYKSFQDKGDKYELELLLKDKANSKLQLDVKNGFLYISIDTKQESKNMTKSTSQSYIVKVPKDGLVDSIDSKYNNGKVTITIPKIKNRQNI